MEKMYIGFHFSKKNSHQFGASKLCATFWFSGEVGAKMWDPFDLKNLFYRAHYESHFVTSNTWNLVTELKYNVLAPKSEHGLYVLDFEKCKKFHKNTLGKLSTRNI